jgi:lipoprotein Spr
MRKSLLIILPIIILMGACSSQPPRPKYKSVNKNISSKDFKRLISGSKKHLGEPYRYGGRNKKGWDCSGFVSGMYYSYLNVRLPRNTRSLYNASFRVKNSKTKPGDLVFFKIRSKHPSHVGIYLGKGRFIHASTSSGVVVSSLKEKYYKKYFIGFRRPKVQYFAQSR